MRLSDVLSKEPNLEFQQVDGFLKKKLPCGGQQRLDVGVVCRAFYCKNCGSDLTFSMGDRAKNSMYRCHKLFGKYRLCVEMPPMCNNCSYLVSGGK